MHPRVIVRVRGQQQRVWRNKDIAILREKSRTPLALYPSNTEKVFPTPRGFRRRWRLAAMAERELKVRGG